MSKNTTSLLDPLLDPEYIFLHLFKAALGEEKDEEQRFILWNQHLCLEFHRLIIVTTIAYTHQLKQLSRECDANKQNETKGRLAQVAYFAHLLSAIVQSNAFISHLQFLDWMGLLQRPKREDRKTTAAFWTGMLNMLDYYKSTEAFAQGEGMKEQGGNMKEQGEEEEEQADEDRYDLDDDIAGKVALEGKC